MSEQMLKVNNVATRPKIKLESPTVWRYPESNFIEYLKPLNS